MHPPGLRGNPPAPWWRVKVKDQAGEHYWFPSFMNARRQNNTTPQHVPYDSHSPPGAKLLLPPILWCCEYAVWQREQNDRRCLDENHSPCGGNARLMTRSVTVR